MDNFIIKKGQYIIGIDFGFKNDIVTRMTIRLKDGKVEILDMENLGFSENWTQVKREEYVKQLEKILDNYEISYKNR